MFLSDIAIKRPVFTTMIMVGLAIAGLLSWRTIGVDLFPRVEFPVISVLSVLPGSDPASIEKTVSQPIEDALSTISSIKRLRSTSANSVSQVVIEFELDKNVDIGFQEVQAKLGTVRSELPQDLEDPIIEKFDIDSSPIMAVVMYGNKDVQTLSHIADKVVKTRLQQVKNVGEIRLVGNREREIWIYVDPAKLEGYSLSVPEVISALKTHHIEIPGGRVETGPQEFVVKTKAEFSSVQDFQDLLLGYQGGYPVRLRDVGSVVDGLEDERSSASLDGKRAISLLVRRQSGTNTVAVAHAVKAEVEKLQKELSAQGIEMEIAQDFSLYIEHSMHSIEFHLIFGGILAVLIVFLFLRNFRITIISALAIPLSVISSFLFMNIFGFTMNKMTMLALSLAIGILIDDAIVVIENIYRHWKKKGSSPQEAAIQGSSEIGLAAFAITMSIVAVFLPVAFMKGIIGRFFYQFGVTVTVAVLMSLFVAFTLTPMLASRFLKEERRSGRIFLFIGNILKYIEEVYVSLLKKALFYRKTVILIACSLLVIMLFSVKYIRSEFIPMEDQSEFFIKAKTPLGSSISATEDSLMKIRNQIKDEPWVKYIFTTIGSDSLRRVNEGILYVKMTEKQSRKISQMQVMDDMRQKLQNISDVKLSIEPVPAVASGTRKFCALQVDITGPDLVELEKIVSTLVDELKKRPGYVDIDTSYEKDSPELSVLVKRDRAAALNVTPSSIAQTVKVLIGGSTIGTFTDRGERYDIGIRADESFRKTADSIYGLSCKNASGSVIGLENLVEVKRSKEALQIDRINRERVISVFVNLQNGEKTLGQAVSEINSLLEGKLPAQYHFQFSGTADTMKESFANLLFALCLAIIAVYMVLASQFESFMQPFVIMLSLPFSIIGAILGILLTWSTLNINTIIGIIMLMGLVTKNAILLVDYTNTLRTRDGLQVNDALMQAGATRLNPILMTTLAMIFGMLPQAVSSGPGSESGGPMAIAIIGGLITSTVLTLVVVPVVYGLMSSKNKPF